MSKKPTYRKPYPPEFRREAVELYRRSGRSLEEIARGKLRKKLPALREALAGRFSGHHAFIASRMLGHSTTSSARSPPSPRRSKGRIAPFPRQVEQLETITGVGRLSAEAVLAELGPDTDRFPPDRHCRLGEDLPRHRGSAGKRRSGKTGKGKAWLRECLIECARAAARSREGYPKAQYLQLRRRRGEKKAVVAVAHSILVIAHHILKEGKPCQDLGGD